MFFSANIPEKFSSAIKNVKTVFCRYNRLILFSFLFFFPTQLHNCSFFFFSTQLHNCLISSERIVT